MPAHEPSDVYSHEVPDLYRVHLDHLTDSAISLEVIKERGYRTIAKEKHRSKMALAIESYHTEEERLANPCLEDLGFSRVQRRAPGIYMPIHPPDGIEVPGQYKPDHPRMNRAKDRPVKYENPTGSSVRLDVPPRCLPAIPNPSVPIYFTEGIKKVDSLASQGACAVGLAGVWGFIGKNEFGSPTILNDFKFIGFRGRVCYIVFDSDVTSNPRVRNALDRLTELIGKRWGGEPRILQLPAGPNGEKVGVDDYFVQGHTLQDLIGLEQTATVAPAVRHQVVSFDNYCVENGCMCRVKHQPHGGEEMIALCNFSAEVTHDIIKDDGRDRTRWFRIIGSRPNGTVLPQVEVPATTFAAMNWVTTEWGMQAVVSAGSNSKDELRAFIQLRSQQAKHLTIYRHTGWRHVGDKPVYLTGAGAIGSDDVAVEMDPALERYSVPKPLGDAADPVVAFSASLRFLEVAPRSVTLPLWATIYLAPLCEFFEPDLTLWLLAGSGSFKSVLSGLALSHFGHFDYHHLPASWRDTANRLEHLLFLTKDAPLVIDDFAPGEDIARARELDTKAGDVIRAQGNRQGRGRLRADSTGQTSYVPRGILITSGEHLPGGMQSRTARIMTIRVTKEDVRLDRVTVAQEETRYYRAAMWYYLSWLQERWAADPDFPQSVRRRWLEARDEARRQAADPLLHPRMPEAAASLFTGLRMAADCCLHYQMLTEGEADTLVDAGQELFTSLSTEQGSRVEEDRPGCRFLAAIRAMVNGAARTALLHSVSDNGNGRSPGPGQTYIGWQDLLKLKVYLDPDAAWAAVYQYYQKNGEAFTVKRPACFEDMKQLGYTECSEGHNTAVAYIEGASRRVLQLKYTRVYSEESKEEEKK